MRSLQHSINSFWISGEVYFAFHEAFWRCFSRVLSPPLSLHINSSIKFPELVRPLFPTSGWSFVPSLWFLNGIFWHPHSFSVSTMGVIASLAFLMFSLCVESNTLFIGTSLPVYSSRNLVSNIWLFLWVHVGAFWSFLNVFIAVGYVRYGFFWKDFPE